MDLDHSQRERIAADLLSYLAAAVPGSVATLRGSLASGRADAYSDIDLTWQVPDSAFWHAVSRTPVIAEQIAPVASLRHDPDFQRSLRRRMVFIRFRDLPLFWRVDLDIVARSVAHDPDFDRQNAAARGTHWSATESSLANAVAALKALLRNQPAEAAALLERGEARIGLVAPAIAPRERIIRLAHAARHKDASQEELATEILRLAVTAL